MTENKGDLISREALKKAIEQGEGFSWDSYGKDDLCVRKKYIDNAPTVEPEITEKQAITKIINSGWLVKHDKELRDRWERPQGKWIMITEFDGFIHAKCSICNQFNDWGDVAFCPWCGADMRGKEE